MKLSRALLVTLLAWAGTASADSWLERDLKACRAHAADDQRLACYDALLPEPVPAPPQSPASAPADPAAPVLLPMAPIRLKGSFSGWQPRMLLQLDNGQVWRYIGDDDSFRSDPLVNPAITIRKSFSGATWLTIAGEKQDGKVTRVR